MQPRRVSVIDRDFRRIQSLYQSPNHLEDFLLLVGGQERVKFWPQQLACTLSAMCHTQLKMRLYLEQKGGSKCHKNKMT